MHDRDYDQNRLTKAAFQKMKSVLKIPLISVCGKLFFVCVYNYKLCTLIADCVKIFIEILVRYCLAV